MELTSDQVEKFRKLFRKRYGYPISEKEARLAGVRLVRLMRLSLKKQEYEKGA